MACTAGLNKTEADVLWIECAIILAPINYRPYELEKQAHSHL